MTKYRSIFADYQGPYTSDNANGSGKASGRRLLDKHLTIGLIASAGATASALFAAWIFVHTADHRGDALALVFALLAWLQIMLVKAQVDNINTMFIRSRRGRYRPATGVRGKAAGGDLRMTRESPPAAYTLDNEPLICVVPTSFAEIRREPVNNVVAIGRRAR